ncbi:MAG: enoyl-CoA hydratase/isomerase family protein [Candidatus Dormiibacterota bacterium]
MPPTSAPRAAGSIERSFLPEGVAQLTITSPARLNAFSSPMRHQLIEAVSELDADDGTRAIVLTGEGDRAFSAGQDLTEAQGFSGDQAQSWVEEWAAVYRAILNLDTPTVAALNGYAVGAGFQVALMCDLRLASMTARVGMPEIDDAIPCVTGSWSLTNLLGRAQISDLVLSGRLVSSDEMLGWGIVSQLVAPDQLLDSAYSLAAVLAKKDRLAVRLDKAWLRRDLLDRLPDAVRDAKSAHAKAFESGEPRRVMAAFLEKAPATKRF